MSIQGLWTSTWRPVREEPQRYLVAGIVATLLIWGQSFLPWIGAGIAALCYLFGLRFIETNPAPLRWPRLIFLTSFTFPLMFLWRVIASWVVNTDWVSINSKLWGLSALFFLLMGHLFVAFAMKEIDADTNLDGWILKAWKRLVKAISPVIIVCFVFSVLFLLALSFGGYGVIAIAPFALAAQGSMTRSSLDADAGERT